MPSKESEITSILVVLGQNKLFVILVQFCFLKCYGLMGLKFSFNQLFYDNVLFLYFSDTSYMVHVHIHIRLLCKFPYTKFHCNISKGNEVIVKTNKKLLFILKILNFLWKEMCIKITWSKSVYFDPKQLKYLYHIIYWICNFDILMIIACKLYYSQRT